MLLYYPLEIYYRIEYASKGSLSFLFSFYPILFLPLFIQKKSSQPSIWTYVEILFAFILFSYSIYKEGFLSLTLASSYWIGISFFPFYKIPFSWGARILILLCPPFSQKWSLLFGPELRIFLTKHTVQVLQQLHFSVTNSGNLLFFNGNSFTIDPECEGLKMLHSLILFHLLSFHWLQTKKLQLTKQLYLALIPISIGLWYFTNLFRIILLILGNVPQDSIAHEMIGIISFLSIVVFPILCIYIIAGNLDFSDSEFLFPMSSRIFPVMSMIFVLTLYWLFPREENAIAKPFPQKSGNFVLEEEDPTHKIASYSWEKQRIIIKKNMEFFRVSHHPVHCWTGSGYKFHYEKDFSLKSGEIIKKAEIQKDNEILDLYWWYEISLNSQKIKTGSEWEWRKYNFRKDAIITQYNLVFPKQMESDSILEKLLNENFGTQSPGL